MDLRGMRGRTTALIAVVVLILLVGAVWAGAQTSSAPTNSPPQPSPLSTGLQPGREGSSMLADDWPSAMDYVSAALKFGLVLLLLYGALWVLRRYAHTGFVRGATDSRRLALLETMPLAPRQALHLVRADDRTLLLGVSDHGITLLAEWMTGEGREPIEDGQRMAAPSPPAPPLPELWERGRGIRAGGGQGSVSHLASAFAQHLRQAIQWREHHAA